MTDQIVIKSSPDITDLHRTFAELSFSYGGTIRCSSEQTAIWLTILADEAEKLADIAKQLKKCAGPND